METNSGYGWPPFSDFRLPVISEELAAVVKDWLSWRASEIYLSGLHNDDQRAKIYYESYGLCEVCRRLGTLGLAPRGLDCEMFDLCQAVFGSGEFFHYWDEAVKHKGLKYYHNLQRATFFRLLLDHYNLSTKEK